MSRDIVDQQKEILRKLEDLEKKLGIQKREPVGFVDRSHKMQWFKPKWG